MKRIIALVLALVFSIGCAAADNKSFNAGFFTDNDSYFEFTVPEDGNSAFIEVKGMSAGNRAFVTPYDSETYYSTVYPELMITDYTAEEAQNAAFRIWIRYRGTKHLNISTVSFILDGIEYRFLDVTKPDWTATKEDGTAAEDAMIMLGRDISNATFFAGLLAKAVEYMEAKVTDPETSLPEAALILHGEEDVETVLPRAFWEEMAVFALSLDEINGFQFLTRSYTGTPCEILGN